MADEDTKNCCFLTTTSNNNSSSNTMIAVMVSKQYYQRVKDYLLTPLKNHPIPWKTLVHHHHSDDDLPTTTNNTTSCCDGTNNNKGGEIKTNNNFHHDDDNNNDSNNSNANGTSSIILDTTETTGNSHSRRGYFLVLFQNVKGRPIEEISPIARQNIAFALKITHQVPIIFPEFDGDTTIIEDAVRRIVETLPLNDIPLVTGNSSSNNRSSQGLRVDVYPKTRTEEICLCLQRVVHEKLVSPSSSSSSSKDQRTTLADTPFDDGPIEMCLSASKCSHRLAIIFSESTKRVYWGWMDRYSNTVDEGIMNIRLNTNAKEEILLVPPLNDFGKDPPDLHPPSTPVSRAYYKLDQLWREYIEPNETDTLSLIKEDFPQKGGAGVSAIDFGSAPGGWTQVLAERTTSSHIIQTIYSIDRGALGERVINLPRVQYIKSLIEDCPKKLLLAAAQVGPTPTPPTFGIVVCDASQLWVELLELFVKLFSSSQQKDDDGNGSSCTSARLKFTLPCILVITLKLPFQTPSSIQRHIELIDEKLPQFLSEMVKGMYYNHNNNHNSTTRSSREHHEHHPLPNPTKVQSRHTVIHLMANSPSERTLLVVFEEEERKKEKLKAAR